MLFSLKNLLERCVEPVKLCLSKHAYSSISSRYWSFGIISIRLGHRKVMLGNVSMNFLQEFPVLLKKKKNFRHSKTNNIVVNINSFTQANKKQQKQHVCFFLITVLLLLLVDSVSSDPLSITAIWGDDTKHHFTMSPSYTDDNFKMLWKCLFHKKSSYFVSILNKSFLPFFLITVLLLLLLDSVSSDPLSITAIWGDDTTLPCDAYINIKALVDPTTLVVKWEKSTTLLVHSSTQPENTPRYKLIKDANYGLRINAVQPTDNGTYSCTAQGLATPKNNTVLAIDTTQATLAPAGLYFGLPNSAGVPWWAMKGLREFKDMPIAQGPNKHIFPTCFYVFWNWPRARYEGLAGTHLRTPVLVEV